MSRITIIAEKHGIADGHDQHGRPWRGNRKTGRWSLGRDGKFPPMRPLR